MGDRSRQVEDRLGEASAALHLLNNAVAALRIQAAVARARARDPAAAEELRTVDACAAAVTDAANRLNDALRGPDALAAPAPAPGGGDDRGAVVAVVDDDELLRSVVARLLAEAGYQVAAFRDAETADMWLSAGHAADVLLCDVELPGHGGDWLVLRARTRRPELPAILLTGHGGAANAAGATVLGKPVDPEALLATVAALVAAAEPRA